MASTDAKPVPQKNVAYRVTFPILDADGDLVTGAASLDSEVSKDGGTFADCTNEATEIATSSGVYYLDLTATEMNADTVAVIVKTGTAGAKTTTIVMYPEEAGDIRVNVTQISGATVSTSTAQIGVNVVNAAGTAWGSGAITAASIAASAITSAKIASGAITSTGIAASAIGATQIAANAITSAKIATDAITATQIAANAIGSSEFAQAAADKVWSTTTRALTDKAGFSISGTKTTLDALNDVSTAQVNTEVDTALADIHLDHLLAADYDPAAKPGTATALLNELVENDAGVSRFTANALEQAPSGGGDATAANQTTIITHLTDIKGATWASSTDTLEAIRDRGDAAWVTGSGTGLTALATGTAQGGTSTTIQLSAGHTFADDELNGNTIKIHTGTGAGQARLITDYTGSTDTATVSPAWITTPDATSQYEVVEGSVTVANIETAAAAQVWTSATRSLTDKAGFSISGTKTTLDALNDIAATDIVSDGNALQTTLGQLDSVALVDEVAGFTSAGLTAIRTQAGLANEDDGLDHLIGFSVDLGVDVTNNSVIARLLSSTGDASTYAQSTDSLQAIRDHVGDGTNLTEAGGTGDHLTAIDLPDQTMNITGNLSGSVGSVTGAVGSVTGSVGSLGTTAKSDVNAEVVDALSTDTYAEPGAVPAATASLAAKVGWLFALARNKITQTATTQTLRNDADSGNISTAAVSDDGTTGTRGEWS